MTASLPRSIRRAISTSPSRVRSGTVPISRKYIRTGSLVLSSAPGVRSSSSSSAPSPVRSSVFSSRRYFWSESMTSIPALPKVLKRSSSSSEDVISDGRSSLTSSYSRYPFSLPMLISCRTSSYFSSIDIHSSSTRAVTPRRDGLTGPPPGPSCLAEFLDTVQQIFLLLPERVNFLSVPARPLPLEPVDFALNRRTLPLPPEPLQRMGTGDRGGRRVRRGGDAGYELGVHST